MASIVNTIIVLDAAPESAALVNLALTVTEVKALVLTDAGLQCDGDRRTSGASSDAVVIAATVRGPTVRFWGRISEAGGVLARAARIALAEGMRGWIEQHR